MTQHERTGHKMTPITHKRSPLPMTENLLSVTATSMSGNTCQIRIEKSCTGKDLKKCIENTASSPEAKASVLKLHNGASEIKDSDKLDQFENGLSVDYTILPGCRMTFNLPNNHQIDDSDTLEVMVPTTSYTYKDIAYALSFYIDYTPVIAKDGAIFENSTRLGELDSSKTYTYDLVEENNIPYFFNGKLFSVEKNVKFGDLLKAHVPDASPSTRLTLEGKSKAFDEEAIVESTEAFKPWVRITTMEKSGCLLL